MSSVQLGAQLRLGEHLALGVNGRDVNRPFLRTDDEALPAEWESMFALRFWDGRVLIDAGSRTFVGAPQVDLLARLAVEPIGGLRVFANAEFGVVDETDSPNGSFDMLLVGAELSLGSTGFEFGTQFDRRGLDDTPSLASVTGYVWGSTAPKKRGLIDGLERWVSYDLNVSVSEGRQSGLFAPTTTSFSELITDFEAMATDDSVSGVFLKLGSVTLGYAQAWEVRRAIERLRENDKTVIAYMTGGSLRDYFVASAANEVWATPATTFEPGGLKTQFINAAGALRKAGIEAQFVRIGDYKSAPELFVRDTPTDAAREQRQAYLDDFYDIVVDAISKGRGLEREKVVGMIDEGGLLPQEAIDRKFIDKLVYRDELDKVFETSQGKRVSFSRGYDRPRTLEAYWRNRPEIAVVVVEGTIVQAGSGGLFSNEILASADVLEPLLEKLSSDSTVKAIVLRIDSPGGSAFASDTIYRAIRRAAARKPVIASMGNAAASGGYYVAAGADTIVAAPTTVTGSIGVFSGKFNVQQLGERIGVNIESLQKGRSVRFGDIFQAWDEEELELVAQSVSYLYQLFLTQASATRPLDEDELDKVARGRVWTGRAAKEKKLIDETGGLLEAIRIAEKKAGLAPGEGDFRVYPEQTFIGGVTDSEVATVLARYGIDATPRISANEPLSLLGRLLSELERNLLLPLVLSGTEPMMLPLDIPVIR
jgi:protease-4